MAKYVALKENKEGNSHLEIETSYIKGKGYFLFIKPVSMKVTNGMVVTSFILFDGMNYKKCLLAATRKSKKAAEQALQLAKEQYKGIVLELLEKWDLQLEKQIV